MLSFYSFFLDEGTMRHRIALTTAAAVSSLLIAGGAGADTADHHHPHGTAFAFTGDSDCLWTPSGSTTGGSFVTSSNLFGELAGGQINATLVLVNGSTGLSGPGVSTATVSGTISISGNTLTLSDLSGTFAGGPLNNATFTIGGSIVLTGAESQDHKTVVFANTAPSAETVNVTPSGGGTAATYTRGCQYSLVATRTGGGGGD
jgi:hypothetical protein